MSYRDRIAAPGPKKLLALDGGGIRGVITLEVLQQMQTMLAAQSGADDTFVLADYFDYVGGTSTGAIIAAGLSKGMRVEELLDIYVTHGQDMFDKATLLHRLQHQYETDRLKHMLRQVLGADTTLGSDDLRTLLLMIMRNATTDSPWPLSNNPKAHYNDPSRPDCNLNLPLWQLVRASTAAPVYFAPELIRVGQHDFVFVDGGVTMYNNPAFQLFLMATMPQYRLRWPTGESELLVVSVGTGTCPKGNDHLHPGGTNVLFNLASLPAALMFAALNEQDLLCRTFGRCRWGAPIDREVGDLLRDDGLLERRLFTYLRYNAELTDTGLEALGLSDIVAQDVQKLDSVTHIDELRRVGQAVAADVRPEHFAGFLPAAT